MADDDYKPQYVEIKLMSHVAQKGVTILPSPMHKLEYLAQPSVLSRMGQQAACISCTPSVSRRDGSKHVPRISLLCSGRASCNYHHPAKLQLPRRLLHLAKPMLHGHLAHTTHSFHHQNPSLAKLEPAAFVTTQSAISLNRALRTPLPPCPLPTPSPPPALLAPLPPPAYAQTTLSPSRPLPPRLPGGVFPGPCGRSADYGAERGGPVSRRGHQSCGLWGSWGRGTVT